MRFTLVVALLVALVGYTTGAELKSEVANNSNELNWRIKGGNENLYIVNFYMPGDKHEDVKKDLDQKVGGNTRYKDLVTYIEVNAARTYQYKDVLEDIGVYNRPSTMYPYVLLVKKGEGYLFRGSNVGDNVTKKITEVIEGRVNFNTAI